MAFLNGVHHVAYRCKNAKETVEWYQKYLDANFILAIAENQVPSTKEPDPLHAHLHRHRRAATSWPSSSCRPSSP